MNTFTTLGVSKHAITKLAKLGAVEPKPVQEKAIPHLLKGGDMVIEAPTGSGKTLAFALPLVARLNHHDAGSPRALIIGPTRELAAQVGQVIASLSDDLKVAVLYGGVGYAAQIRALQTADIVVGCPGRVLDLCQQGHLSLGRVEFLVLDEADEMLDAGFAPSVERLVQMCTISSPSQKVLASATMPVWVQKMITKHLRAPLQVRVRGETEPELEHGILPVSAVTRFEALAELLKADSNRGTIVFMRTKHGTKKIAKRLNGMGIKAIELQGNLSQPARDRAIASFRGGKSGILVATNVAARGLDVEHVDLVVNYELPESAQLLTHRVGRTARNGRAGRAITFVAPEEMGQWNRLRKAGAPSLRFLDATSVLDGGAWQYLA